MSVHYKQRYCEKVYNIIYIQWPYGSQTLAPVGESGKDSRRANGKRASDKEQERQVGLLVRDCQCGKREWRDTVSNMHLYVQVSNVFYVAHGLRALNDWASEKYEPKTLYLQLYIALFSVCVCMYWIETRAGLKLLEQNPLSLAHFVK